MESRLLPLPTDLEATGIWYDRLQSIYAYNGISGSAFYLFAFLGLASLANLSKPNSFLPRFGIALLLLSAIVSVLNLYPVSARLSLCLTPVVILITISGLKMISDRLGAIIGAALSIAVLSTSIHAGVTRFSRGFQVEELHPLLETLSSRATESDHLYIYYGAIPAFRFYNRSLGMDPSNFRFGSRARNHREQYLLDIENMKSHGRVWFVFSHVYSDEERFFLAELEDFVTGKSAPLFICATSTGSIAAPLLK